MNPINKSIYVPGKCNQYLLVDDRFILTNDNDKKRTLFYFDNLLTFLDKINIWFILCVSIFVSFEFRAPRRL